jgi:two-component system response regulator MtrA
MGAMATTVLVCDNEEPLRALVRASLDGDDYVIVEAPDGDAGLALTRSARPDLIVLDMMMPGKSGIEVLEELRADPELAAIPVVMLTARTQAADRERAAEAGATRFLAKPFSPRALVALVEELLGRSRS